jgi:hypothetical protein
MTSEITVPERIRDKNLCNKTLLVPASRSCFCVAIQKSDVGAKPPRHPSRSFLASTLSLSAIIGGSSPGSSRNLYKVHGLSPYPALFISLLCIVAPCSRCQINVTSLCCWLFHLSYIYASALHTLFL